MSLRTSSSRGVSSSSAAGLGRGARTGGEVGDQASQHRRRDERVAFRDDVDGVDELLRRSVLEQEAARSSAQRLVDVFVEIEGGEHQHPRRVVITGRRLEDLPRRLEAIHHRHAHVHEHDVRGRARAPGQRPAAPSAACPTTTMSRCAPSRAPKPSRTIAWSSAIRHLIIARARSRSHERDRGGHGVAAHQRGLRGKRPAEQRDALAHARDPMTGAVIACAGPGGRAGVRWWAVADHESIWWWSSWMPTATCEPGAWRRAFESASWTIRYAHKPTAVGTFSSTFGIVSSTSTPARRVVWTSSGTSASRGCGARSGSSSLRRTPSRLRRSASAARAALLSDETRPSCSRELGGRRLVELGQAIGSRLGLHGDQRHVVCDDVVHLPRDPGALLEHRPAFLLVLGLCDLLRQRVAGLAGRAEGVKRHGNDGQGGRCEHRVGYAWREPDPHGDDHQRPHRPEHQTRLRSPALTKTMTSARETTTLNFGSSGIAGTRHRQVADPPGFRG